MTVLAGEHSGLLGDGVEEGKEFGGREAEQAVELVDGGQDEMVAIGLGVALRGVGRHRRFAQGGQEAGMGAFEELAQRAFLA